MLNGVGHGRRKRGYAGDLTSDVNKATSHKAKAKARPL